jgi:hypothetical protein
MEAQVLTDQLNAEMVPLTRRIRELGGLGDDALTLALQFEREWLSLERRLLALGVGYVRFLAEHAGDRALATAAGDVATSIAEDLTRVMAAAPADRPAVLHGSLSRIRGHDILGPVTEQPVATCGRYSGRLIRAVRAGDVDEVLLALDDLDVSWPTCQDRMVHLCASLAGWIARTYGEETMDAAHLAISDWAEAEMDGLVDPAGVGTVAQVRQVLALLRSHTMAGRVSLRGREVHVEVDCSSGLRMWRRGVSNFGMATGPGAWVLGREQLPYYCCRCTTNLMRFHESRGRIPAWRLDPPRSEEDVCRWSSTLSDDEQSVPEGPTSVR